MEHKRLKWLWFFQGWHVNLRKIWSVSLAPEPPLYLEKFALLQLRTVVKAVYIIVINSVNRNNFLPDPFRFYHIFGYPSYFVTCREVINFITHQVHVILVITTGSWEQVLGAWVFEEKCRSPFKTSYVTRSKYFTHLYLLYKIFSNSYQKLVFHENVFLEYEL